MLSKNDEKKSRDGINFGAVFQLLLAATIFIVWGRSIFATFSGSTRNDDSNQINVMRTIQAEQVSFLMENQQRENKIEVLVSVPTQEINIIVQNVYPTPEPTHPPPISSPTPGVGLKSTLGKSYDFIVVPYQAGREPTTSEGEEILIRLSWYYPPFGNVLQDNPYHINCSRVPGTDLPECDYTASGFTWFQDVGYWAACPVEWEFGTKIIIENKEFLCMDRGGAIVYENEVPWIDILYPTNPFPQNAWGSVMRAIKIDPFWVGE